MSDAIPPIRTRAATVVPVSVLTEHPHNTRRGDVGAIYESIKANGFVGALVVQRSTGHILVGNHTFLAAKHAGLTELPVLYVEVDDDRARRILLADNRASDQADYDTDALASELRELAGTPDALDGTGYTGNDLDDLLRSLADPLPPVDTPLPPEHKGGFTTGQSKQIVLTLSADEFPLVRHRLDVARDRLGVAKDGTVLAKLLADLLPDVTLDATAPSDMAVDGTVVPPLALGA